MTIRYKIFGMFLGTVILLFGVLFVFFKSQDRQNKLLLKAATTQQVELVNTAINVKSSQLDQVVHDLTLWDDLIVYIQKPDQKWAADNIGTSLSSFQLHSISVFNLSDKLIYNFGVEPELIFTNPLEQKNILHKTLRNGKMHFFKYTPKGVLEISTSTINPSLDVERKTPAKGVFLLTKFWDSDYLLELSKNTSSSIQVTKSTENKDNTIEKDSLVVYKRLFDEASQKALVLTFKKSNAALSNFNEINNFVFLIVSGFLALLIFSFFLILYIWLRKPLIIISQSLSNGDVAGLNKLEKNNDEFGQVARLIKIFNHQKKELYRENIERQLTEEKLLRQSNILRGMAEASNYLLTGENPDLSINTALEVIGKGSGIDQIFIYKNEIDSEKGFSKVKRTYSWVTDEIVDLIDPSECNEFQYTYDENAWYFPFFKRMSVKGLITDFRPELRTLFERQKLKSLILVPIVDPEDNSFWGIVGFADCKTDHNWTQGEENTLKMLANNIRNAIRRYEIQENLRSAMIQSQAADRAKSEFLASMSHEIRTPMNGVFGMTSLLLHTELTPRQREYVKIIETSGDSLLNIINEILDFSKIESGHMQLENNIFDLRQCIEDVLDLAAPKALEKHIEILFYIEPEINHSIFGDGFRLRQIIVNLVGNAIKFTDEGEIFIHIMLKSVVEKVVTLEFSIKDTGIGIPPEKIAGLFSPFIQADTTTTRKYGGSGLGLAISSKLVNLMNGTIWVDSVEGQGSDFRFTIETQFADPAIETDPLPQKFSVLQGKNILIVDDNPSNRKILELQCSYWGMKAVSVESGSKALELLNTGTKFDIGILDMQMPGMDGISLARNIRHTFTKAELPLIMLTSMGFNIHSDDMQQLFAAYVNKPIKHSQLADILLKILSPVANFDSVYESFESELGQTAIKYPFEILVAEDNIINQKMIRIVLQLLGYSTDLVANGLEVIEAVKRKQYNLIFMDIQMPEMDGYEATRIIIDHLKNERPLIIAMTANAMKSDIEKCMQTGMDDYITKPLKIEHLQKVFQLWGEKRKAKTGVFAQTTS